MLAMEQLKILPMNGITDFEAEKSYNPKGATKRQSEAPKFELQPRIGQIFIRSLHPIPQLTQNMNSNGESRLINDADRP